MQFEERHKLQSALREAASQLPLNFSPEVLEQLLDYLALLHKWNAVYNLTAVRDPSHMLTLHLLDCMATVPAFVNAQRLLDVGSGAGLPGVVIALWARQNAPTMQVHLIDTVHKKTAFLTQVKAELGLRNVIVHTGRVEQLEMNEKCDVITSRAFAELSDFVRWSGHLLASGGELIALKGQAASEELERLPAEWQITGRTAVNVPGLNAQRHLVHVTRARLGSD
ncbi:MAG: 16S rRNA (guanine(527)-N(7))-methyltransferase RsmG [Betaproteobacteria bacterium]|nr:16S rRNA (guanine(527)-N(7))-methyltransferase RsmG [Betaproteobacteria bacterium]